MSKERICLTSKGIREVIQLPRQQDLLRSSIGDSALFRTDETRREFVRKSCMAFLTENGERKDWLVTDGLTLHGDERVLFFSSLISTGAGPDVRFMTCACGFGDLIVQRYGQTGHFETPKSM